MVMVMVNRLLMRVGNGYGKGTSGIDDFSSIAERMHDAPICLQLSTSACACVWGAGTISIQQCL